MTNYTSHEINNLSFSICNDCPVSLDFDSLQVEYQNLLKKVEFLKQQHQAELETLRKELSYKNELIQTLQDQLLKKDESINNLIHSNSSSLTFSPTPPTIIDTPIPKNDLQNITNTPPLNQSIIQNNVLNNSIPPNNLMLINTTTVLFNHKNYTISPPLPKTKLDLKKGKLTAKLEKKLRIIKSYVNEYNSSSITQIINLFKRKHLKVNRKSINRYFKLIEQCNYTYVVLNPKKGRGNELILTLRNSLLK